MTLRIEKNIPIPPRARFPFAELEVGDSFLVPADQVNWNGRTSMVARVANTTGRRLNRKFVCRTNPDRSVRVWREA